MKRYSSKKLRLLIFAVAAALLLLLGTWLLLRERSVEELYGEYPEGVGAYRPGVGSPGAPRPNVIIIYVDDLGYGDLGVQGNVLIDTPNIDRVAREGVRFTQFYSSAAVCAPARAALLTGRYPFRTGVIGNTYPEDEPIGRRLSRTFGVLTRELGVLDIREKYLARGLAEEELTLAEGLAATGYRTAMVGKWHLGDYSRDPGYNPTRHGFDHYLGVPYSNDMVPLPLYRNETMLEADLGLDKDQARLTALYTEEALAFVWEHLERHRDEPFFLYVAHTFPHQPLFASPEFAGRSEAGPFGDAVEEIDWSVGELLSLLEQEGLAENTLLIFSSDNGPWYEGSAGGLRGRKGQSFEGGFRVPFLARWPGQIDSGGVIDEPAMGIDLLPTIFELAGLALPADRIVDGESLAPLLLDPGSSLPERPLYFYHYDKLEAVRLGEWKYYPRVHRYTWPIPLDAASIPDAMAAGQLGTRWPLLYNVERDPGEAYNLLDRNPGVAEELRQVLHEWQGTERENARGFLH